MARMRSVAGMAAVLAMLVGAACGPAPADAPAPTSRPASTAASEPTNPRATATLVPGGPSATATAEPPAEPTGNPPAPTAAGSAVPDDLRGADVERIPTSDKVVALTFDAGANADAVARMLATLADEGVSGTFFLTGRFVRQFPDESRSIAAAGHRLGNHSVTHPEFTSLTSGQIRDEVRAAERDILDIAGGDPRPLFRFPFGDRDARAIEAINDLGYVAVRWTVDTLGWQGTSGGRSADEVTQRVVSTVGPGQIVLMHVGSHPTDGSMLDADALPDVIATLRAAGYRFVTLDALLS
jgi:peptidoglycan/xylan/chitin deacetylase (PgdA/CDA1 family)